MGQTQFVGSKFGICGGFEWVRSSILVGEPRFGSVRISVCPDLGMFQVKQVRSWGFLEGFEVRFWWTNLGSGEYEVRPVKFKAHSKIVIFGFDPTLQWTAGTGNRV